MTPTQEGKLELLTDKNSVLVPVDYPSPVFKGVASGDKTNIKNAEVCAAKAAGIPGIPVVLSAINPGKPGKFIPEITQLSPGQEVFARKIPGFDAFEDEKTWDAFTKTGRKNVVVSGLWTSMCFTCTALHAVKEGYEVYGLMDAAGDSTADAHQFCIKRMPRAGVVPVTFGSLASERLHDRANPKAGERVKGVYTR